MCVFLYCNNELRWSNLRHTSSFNLDLMYVFWKGDTSPSPLPTSKWYQRPQMILLRNFIACCCCSPTCICFAVFRAPPPLPFTHPQKEMFNFLDEKSPIPYTFSSISTSVTKCYTKSSPISTRNCHSSFYLKSNGFYTSSKSHQILGLPTFDWKFGA